MYTDLLLGGIRRDTGMAMALISHDLGIVAENTDQVCVMYAGRIVEERRIATIFARRAPSLHRGTSRGLAELPDRGGDSSPIRRRRARAMEPADGMQLRAALLRWPAADCNAGPPPVVGPDSGHRVAACGV